MVDDFKLEILSGQNNSIDSDKRPVLHNIVVDGPSGLVVVHKDGVLTIRQRPNSVIGGINNLIKGGHGNKIIGGNGNRIG